MKNAIKFPARTIPHFCLLVFALLTTIGAFSGGIWAALGIGFAIIAFVTTWVIEKQLPRPDQRFLLLAIMMLALCAVLNLHSTIPHLSWMKWEELITIFLPLSLLTAPAIQKQALSSRLFKILPWLVAASALALSLELHFNEPLYVFLHGHAEPLTRYNRGFSYLVVLAFPIMAGLLVTKRRALLLPFILVLFIPASLTESRTAKLALILGLLTMLAAYFLPWLMRRLIFLVPVLSIGWPFAAQKIFIHYQPWVERLPGSWEDRVEIWDYMSYRILDRPLLGWGLGSSSTLSFTEPHGALYHWRVWDKAPHPHNGLIQLWVELGVPGVIFGVVFALLVLWRINRLHPTLLPFALGAWMAAYCLTMLAYDFWTDSLWATFAMAGFAFALLQRQMGRQSS